MLDDAEAYAALQARDPAADGQVFAGVLTTRIYCRPVCPARTPLRRNVRFFPSAAQAQAAGFRPCLRCRPETAPDSPAWLGSLASVNRALRLIEEGALAEGGEADGVGAGGGVEALAGRLGVTGRHLRRLFVRRLGVSPSQVEATRRIHLAKTLLHDTRLPVTEIAYAAGYGSVRRFNEAFAALFGRSPGAIRRDGAGCDPPPRDAGEPLRFVLRRRTPLDWRARWRELAADGATLEGEACRVDGCAGEPRACVTLRPGRGDAVQVEIAGAPVRSLARVLAAVKRDLLPADG